MALGLLSIDRPDLKFLQKLARLANSSATLWFPSQTRKKASPNLFSELYERKKITNQPTRRARTRHYFAIPILLCFSDVFFKLHFQMLLLAMFLNLTKQWVLKKCIFAQKDALFCQIPRLLHFLESITKNKDFLCRVVYLCLIHLYIPLFYEITSMFSSAFDIFCF